MRMCIVPGCGKKHLAYGYCKNHYQQWNSRGRPLIWTPDEGQVMHPRYKDKRRATILSGIPGIVIPIDLYQRTCLVIGCDTPPALDGLCGEHHTMAVLTHCLDDWTLGIEQVHCAVPACMASPEKMMLCKKHHSQWRYAGRPSRWTPLDLLKQTAHPEVYWAYNDFFSAKGQCIVPGCTRGQNCLSRCSTHFRRYLRRLERQYAA